VNFDKAKKPRIPKVVSKNKKYENLVESKSLAQPFTAIAEPHLQRAGQRLCRATRGAELKFTTNYSK
jgi:hypothetical protein